MSDQPSHTPTPTISPSLLLFPVDFMGIFWHMSYMSFQYFSPLFQSVSLVKWTERSGCQSDKKKRISAMGVVLRVLSCLHILYTYYGAPWSTVYGIPSDLLLLTSSMGMSICCRLDVIRSYWRNSCVKLVAEELIKSLVWNFDWILRWQTWKTMPSYVIHPFSI